MLQTDFNVCTSVQIHVEKERRGFMMRFTFLLGLISTAAVEILINDKFYLECTIQAEWGSSKQILFFST